MILGHQLDEIGSKLVHSYHMTINVAHLKSRGLSNCIEQQTNHLVCLMKLLLMFIGLKTCAVGPYHDICKPDHSHRNETR